MDRSHVRFSALGEALDDVSQQVGFCPGAAAGALRWLQLDEGVKLGRLRRSELMQLASSIDRFWRKGDARPADLPASGA
jgi:hypothetical protein